MVAESPALFFKPELGKEIKLKGPERIEEFGVAEFELEHAGSLSLINKPTLAQLRLTCGNCPQ